MQLVLDLLKLGVAVKHCSLKDGCSLLGVTEVEFELLLAVEEILAVSCADV